MKPLDPRLLKQARAARGYVVLTAGLGVITAALVVAQAVLIASILAPAVEHSTQRSALATRLGLLAAVVAARAVAAWAQERFAMRAAAKTIADLREQTVTHALALGPRWLADGHGPSVTTLVTRGLEALEPYFVRYLPQLLLAATVTPAAWAVVLGFDWVSAVIIAVTIPLVPLFMILVGQLTAGTSERRMKVMQRLGAQVLDLLAGLPTLRAFGRQSGPERRVAALGEANRKATMGTLRVAFLSGMVLELLTTLSVAIVAVSIGLRLVVGKMDLEPALMILMLAPEVYLPMRQVGMQFHASTDGIAAAQEVFDILGIATPQRGTQPAPALAGATITAHGIGVRAAGRGVIAPAGLDLTLDLNPPGRVIALVGPSGAGKTTSAQVLLGLVQPDAGTVRITAASGHGTDLADIDLDTYWKQIAWVPQRPPLAPGTLLEVVAGGRDIDQGRLEQVARTTGLDDVVASLADGWDTLVGRGGVGLSVGQRQRVALTAALLDDPAAVPLVILDEPTAHLDARSEAVVLDTVRLWREQGRTVVVIAHRPALVRIADEVITVHSAPDPDSAPTATPEPDVPSGVHGFPAVGPSPNDGAPSEANPSSMGAAT